MDPEVTAALIVAHLNEALDAEEPIHAFTALRERLDDLEMWIHNGGFPPKTRYAPVKPEAALEFGKTLEAFK